MKKKPDRIKRNDKVGNFKGYEGILKTKMESQRI